MKLTPMLQQYFDLKKKYPKEILFFRMGDFYEMFGQDALVSAKILNIALTSRHKGSENEMPMCGIPYHALDNYLCKLTKAKKSVAICEQLSDPKLPGIVKRGVVRVVTPGTTFDDAVLDNKRNNYILAIKKFKLAKGNYSYGLAFADLTTGEFRLNEFLNISILKNEIFKINPAEIILDQTLASEELIKELFVDFTYNIYSPLLTLSEEDFLCDHFNVKSLSGFGVNEKESGVKVAAYLLNYLLETQMVSLDHLQTISLYNYADYMLLDRSTIRNLELITTSWDNNYDGSLLSVIDNTNTAMGSRLLRNWLLRPLVNEIEINKRLDSSNYFFEKREIINDVEEIFKKIVDIERVVAKIGCHRVNARDLNALKRSLKLIPSFLDLIKESEVPAIEELSKKVCSHEKLIKEIEQTILEEPALAITDGNIINDGYNADVDELREIIKSGKDWLKKLQEKEIERTNISKLKIKFNKVFGYYIEITRGSLDMVPDDYIRKQTLVNAERFITPELKEYEEKALGAEEKIKKIEFELFESLRESIKKYLPELQKTAYAIAQYDCFIGFAKCGLVNNYVKPKIIKNGEIIIKDGRHPVIEKIQPHQDYIPNDLTLGNKQNFILLTGPNMSGKSSFLRQNALIALLAHIGSFVPASNAIIPITDRIFTRVGANDNLGKGESTFMVEMQEAALIINNATERSLIILDELGRGTSTYDGLSLAWAITEFIINKIKAKTLFATHYHELINVINKNKKASNYSVAVKEKDNGVVFLHKVLPGGVNKSYGVEVAKLAGLPRQIIIRSLDILEYLESEAINESKKGQKTLPLLSKKREDPLINDIRSIDINNITPIQALEKLNEIIQRAKDKKE